jgi:predicted esterase YcpF (UPF0227 family)
MKAASERMQRSYRLNNMKKILYCHGYGAGHRIENALKENIDDDFYIYAPRLWQGKMITCQELKDEISRIKKLASDIKPDIIVGVSLGGFGAAFCKGFKRILVNPALQPSFCMERLVNDIDETLHVSEKELKKIKEFEETLPDDHKDVYGLLSYNDNFFGPEKTQEFQSLFVKKYRGIDFMDDLHRISNENVKDKLIPLIYEVLSKEELKESQRLRERIINCWTKEDMKKHLDEVWNVLSIAYESLGGLICFPNGPEELLAESMLWKIARIDGEIVAINAYKKNPNGRKLLVGGGDGSPEGRKAFYHMLKEDIDMEGRSSFVESSDGMEAVYGKLGGVPIPSDQVEEILNRGKPKSEWKHIKRESDQFHYTREIGGEMHTKIMFGNFGNEGTKKNAHKSNEEYFKSKFS